MFQSSQKHDAECLSLITVYVLAIPCLSIYTTLVTMTNVSRWSRWSKRWLVQNFYVVRYCAKLWAFNLR